MTSRLILFFMCCWLTVSCQSAGSDEAAANASQPTFEPTNESIATHELPEWYQNAKLGIFIHWGLYSVPGWARGTEMPLEETLAKDGGLTWFSNNPYAEWYLNSLKIEGSTTQEYHEQTYGADFSYYDFVPEFNQEVAEWDPDAMAKLFAGVGAGYVVLTTKHHDGFLLWPSEYENPFRENYTASRDIVGELTEAVRNNDMRMGLYYSSGLDWTFNDHTIKTFQDLFMAVPQDSNYVRYIDNHWRELMDRYEPSVLWADIGSPQAYDPVPMIADYYNMDAEGVVNNRHKMEMTSEGFGSPIHHDFTTPEYQVLDTISDKKWETCRGIGLSFGYNRTEDVAEFLSIEELVESFVDIVSKNGNLLLNVGPRADGSIPEGQRVRLEGLGAWLDTNGEAIFGTNPWITASAETTNGDRVRFTAKDGVVYAILLDTPSDPNVVIEGLPLESAAMITSLQTGEELPHSLENGTLSFTIDEAASVAHSFKITL